MHKGIRISGSVSIERAIEAYTKHAADKLGALVILGDVTTSKDRNVESDATGTQGAGTEFRQRIIMPFNVYVFVPTSAQLSARAARDQMEDVRIALFKSILRVKFGAGLQSITEYGVISEGDAFFDYNGAFYIHEFTFSTVQDIIYDDTVDPDENVAFRDIELQFEDEFPCGYFDLHKLCDMMNLSLGKTRDVIARIEGQGYHHHCIERAGSSSQNI